MRAYRDIRGYDYTVRESGGKWRVYFRRERHADDRGWRVIRGSGQSCPPRRTQQEAEADLVEYCTAREMWEVENPDKDYKLLVDDWKTIDDSAKMQTRIYEVRSNWCYKLLMVETFTVSPRQTLMHRPAWWVMDGERKVLETHQARKAFDKYEDLIRWALDN